MHVDLQIWVAMLYLQIVKTLKTDGRYSTFAKELREGEGSVRLMVKTT